MPTQRKTIRCAMCGNRFYNAETDRFRDALEEIAFESCPNAQAGTRPAGCSCPSCRARRALHPRTAPTEFNLNASRHRR